MAPPLDTVSIQPDTVTLSGYDEIWSVTNVQFWRKGVRVRERESESESEQVECMLELSKTPLLAC
jgi:hypothetical protein